MYYNNERGRIVYDYNIILSGQRSVVNELFDQVGDHLATQNARSHDGVGFLAGLVVVVVRADRVLGVHVGRLFRVARDDRYHVQRHAQPEHVVLAHLFFQPADDITNGNNTLW